MNKKEILEVITEWETIQKALEVEIDIFCDLTGAQPDSALLTAIYDVVEAHTVAVGELIGDGSKWLDWWKYECQFGFKPMSAAKPDGKFRMVKTLKQLAGMIAE